MYGQVNPADFASDGAGAFGSGTSMEDLQNLNKALEAQEITGRETANLTTASGAPLKVESLDKTLKILTFTETATTIWKNMPKKPAYNTVEEFNQLSSYGTDRGGFNNEGELPVEEDSTYIRRAQLVKFLGITKAVTHPLQLVNTMVGNVVEREIKNGTLWILRKMEKALTVGDASVIPQEFNGLYTQHQQNDVYGGSLDTYFNQNETLIDLRGSILKEGNIEQAARGIIENYGLGSNLFAPPQVLSSFVQNFYGNKFIPINTEAITAGVVGQNVQEFQSQYGPIKLNWSVFMNPSPTKAYNAGATSSLAPTAPTATSVTPVSTDASSKWATSDAGTYYYAVSAVNRYGESALTVLNSGGVATIVSGGSVDLVFAAGSGPNPGTGYTIYRSNKQPGSPVLASATFYPIFTISNSAVAGGYDGATTNTVRDRNRIMPGTYQAFLIQLDQETVEFAQLAPLMKMDLAIVSPAYRFMVLLYGTPLLYAPKRMVRFVNIGI